MNFAKHSANKSRKYAAKIIVALIFILSTMSCLVISQANRDKSENNQPGAIASEKTCGAGWAIRLVDVEEELSSDGWKTVTAWIAFENVDAPFVGSDKDLPQYDTPNWGGSNYLGMGADFIAVSGEGYRYDARLDYERHRVLGVYWVPPGFRYRSIALGSNAGFAFIWFRAAETTSNYTIETNCGTLNLSQNKSLLFPVENLNNLSYLNAGTPVTISEGVFTVVNVDSDCESAKMSNFESAVCIEIEFRNNSQGYEADPKIEVAVIGEAGILYTSCGAYLMTGPGQTKVSSFDCPTYTNRNRIAILSRAETSEYWLIRIDK
jgi:hypothetical protein